MRINFFLLISAKINPIKAKKASLNLKDFTQLHMIIYPIKELFALYFLFIFRKDFEASKHLISQVKKDILSKLKPLLDRAEVNLCDFVFCLLKLLQRSYSCYWYEPSP